MRLDELIGRYVCETLSLWPPFKPWNCGCRLSRKRLRFRFGQNSWSKWYGSVIIEVDIHERPGSTGVSKSRRKINVRGDNQSGILMTLKNHAGFYYFSLFLGLITGCCSGKWALTHWHPPPLRTPLTPSSERAIQGGSMTGPERQQKLSPVWPQFWWLSHWMVMFNLLLA